MNGLYVLRIVRIDQRPDGDHDIACSDLVFGQRLGPGAVVDQGVYSSSSITCIDMNRFPAFGSVIVTGPASRSNTADE